MERKKNPWLIRYLSNSSVLDSSVDKLKPKRISVPSFHFNATPRNQRDYLHPGPHPVRLHLRLCLLAALQLPIQTHLQLRPAPPPPPLDTSSIGSGNGPDTSPPTCLGINPPLNSLSGSSAPPSPAPGPSSGRNQLSCRRPLEPVRHSRQWSPPVRS
jgi:hypothetical protein